MSDQIAEAADPAERHARARACRQGGERRRIVGRPISSCFCASWRRYRWSKGLYHWAASVRHRGACSTVASRPIRWPGSTATVFFAVIDLVAAVGLWLAAAWGAVVWLTSVVSMAVVEVFFPQVYGGSNYIVLVRSNAAWRLSVARDPCRARAAGVKAASSTFESFRSFSTVQKSTLRADANTNDGAAVHPDPVHFAGRLVGMKSNSILSN
jgi:hypothetical protein